MKKTGAVRASLNAIPTTYAIFFVVQHHPIPAYEGGANRTYLNAWRVGTVVAQLGNEESPEDVYVPFESRKTIDAPVGTIHISLPFRGDDVPLHPGAKIIRLPGNVVLLFAGIRAPSTTYTSVNVYSHGIIMLGGVILLGLLTEEKFTGGKGEKEKSGKGNSLGEEIQKLSPGQREGFLFFHHLASG